MMTCLLACPGPIPWMLGTLLLLAGSLSAQNGGWDSPTCTLGVVSVTRGECAVMGCNISNAFSHVTIRLSAHGQDRTIFLNKAQGNFQKEGWQLQVEGGVAQLVIPEAQDSHAGLYTWHLTGHQRNNRQITLNVSEPHDLQEGGGLERSTRSWGPGTPQVVSSPAVGPRPMVGVILAAFFLMLVVAVLAWCRRHQPPKFAQVRL
ncbi:secreted and transmembrane protein 1 isoform X1 [Cynocephalus volans]|uniref:secreted and transmembrane protein 1 isoform X1 n=1 Tax=Cynocephalus volans TaxID=110931 RepID=UPI002FCC3C2B